MFTITNQVNGLESEVFWTNYGLIYTLSLVTFSNKLK